MTLICDFLRSGRTPKRYFAGTHRICPPDETWARIRPLLEKFGITRIADITGLDRIGIPVAIAVRPLSRSIVIAAGKGVDLAAAKVSAAMEAIECAHAEAISLPLVFASREEILRSKRAVELDSVPLLINHDIDDHSRLMWIEGRDIVDGAATMVPYEIVHAHFAPPRLPGSTAFLSTTNGLASGNSIAEAICHGLFEVIERDSLNLWSRLTPPRRHERLINLNSIRDPVANDAIERLTEAGFKIAIWDVTSNLSIPAFHCMIVDAADPIGHPGTGTGCHLHDGIAVARALFEAVQVRATYISGGRDDLSRREYDTAHMQSFRATVGSSEREAKTERRAEWPAPLIAEFFEDDIERTAARLGKAGIGSVVVVDLSQPDTGIAVVRVIVPGLEGPLYDDAAAGERARQFSQ